MRLLVIDSATRACSVALFDDGALIGQCHEVIGRGHAERLVPMIAALPDRGRAEQIAVDVGPGSFTGIRIGIAAARALGLAWHAEVGGYACHALMAARALADHPDATEVGVVMTGGHGEYFVAQYDRNLQETRPLVSLPPTEAARYLDAPLLTGDCAAALATDTGAMLCDLPYPVATDYPLLRALPPLSPAPLYGRAPDAKLPGGRSPDAA